MSRLVPWMSLALLSGLLSGCVLPFGGGSTTAPAIVKKIVVSLDDEVMEHAEGIEDVLQASFEYTHQGGSVSAGEVEAQFLDEAGQSRNRPLSSFTSKSNLERGDRVTIDHANLTSGLVIRQGATVLAQRDGLREDWFTAEGVPLPLTFGQPGIARWTVGGQTDLRANGRSFSVDETFVERVEGILGAATDGTLLARTSSVVAGPRVELEARLHGVVDVEFDALYREEGVTHQAGLDTRFVGWANGTAGLQFDAQRDLRRAGFGGDVYADGDVVAWDDDHPKGTNWHPEDMEHPLVDERHAYEEEAVEPASDVDAFVRDFVDRLWGTRIGLGDDYRFSYESGDAEHFVRFTFIIQVVGEETRTVAGRALDTFRIAQSMSFYTRAPETGQVDFDLARHTIWLSKEHYLPVAEQGKFQKSFTRQDVEKMLKGAGDLVPVSIPEDAQFVLDSQTNFQLEEFTGDLTTAPLLGAFGWTSVPQAGAVPLLGVFGFMSDIGGDDYDGPPSISFDESEEEDRLMVTSASSDATWGRLAISADEPGVYVELNSEAGYWSDYAETSYDSVDLSYMGERPVVGGDYLDFCMGGNSTYAPYVIVTVKDTTANMMVGQYSFTSVQAC